jgi:hypothetical protein
MAFTTQPASQSASCGSAVSFTAAISGTSTPTFAWRKSGVPIDPTLNPTAATASLQLVGIVRLDAGVYTVLVTDSGGCQILSSPATLSICIADFNCSGHTDTSDIFDFINAWFAGSPAANSNGTNGLEVQDVFDFLNTWFFGCV